MTEYCDKCGAEIVLSIRKHVTTGGIKKRKKVILDPFFNNEPHGPHCMHARLTGAASPELEPLLVLFLSKISRRQRKVIGAVGRAREA